METLGNPSVRTAFLLDGNRNTPQREQPEAFLAALRMVIGG